MILKTFIVLREPTTWNPGVQETLILLAEQLQRHFGEQLQRGAILRAHNAQKSAIRTSGFLARKLRVGELKLPEWQIDGALEYALPQIAIHAESHTFMLVVSPENIASRLHRDFVARICNISDVVCPQSLKTCEALSIEVESWIGRRATLKGRVRVLFH